MAQEYATRDHLCGPAGEPGGVAPELNEISDELISVWLGIAAHLIGLARWRQRARDGHALLTAHLLIANGVGEEGYTGDSHHPVTADSLGPASSSYQVPMPSDAELGTTSYGKAFLVLRRVVRGVGSGIIGNTRIRRPVP